MRMGPNRTWASNAFKSRTSTKFAGRQVNVQWEFRLTNDLRARDAHAWLKRIRGTQSTESKNTGFNHGLSASHCFAGIFGLNAFSRAK